MVTVDSLGRTQYTFQFYFQDTPDNVFYNLVTGEDNNPDFPVFEPYVIIYTCSTRHLQTFINSGFNLNSFQGSITIHAFNEFFEGTGSFNKGRNQRKKGKQSSCDPASIHNFSSGGGAGIIKIPSKPTGYGFYFTTYHTIPDGRTYVYTRDSTCHHKGQCSVYTVITPIPPNAPETGVKKGGADPCSGCPKVPSNGITANLARIQSKISYHLPLIFSQTELDWLARNKKVFSDVLDILIRSKFSFAAKAEAKLTAASLSSKVPWTGKRGSYKGRASLKYKSIRTIKVNGQNLSQYLLLNNDVLSEGDYRLCTGCSESRTKTYYFKRDLNLWYEYRVPASSNTAGDLDHLIGGFWTGAKFVGRYVLPVEDVIILIDGKDWDGVEQSRVQTAGFMLVGLIPGGKFAKPVTNIGKNIPKWFKVVREGSITVVKVVNAIPESTLLRFEKYCTTGIRTQIDDLLRSGAYSNNLIIEGSEVIADISKKLRRKLTWSEVKALFKRGSNFNIKGRFKYGNNMSEIVLTDGKRLDTYVHKQKIISRKATDIDNIQESTWRNYCNELVTKYKAGKLTNSRKLKTQVKLTGKYYIEIPITNKNAKNLSKFKKIALEYGKENGGVNVTFLAE